MAIRDLIKMLLDCRGDIDEFIEVMDENDNKYHIIPVLDFDENSQIIIRIKTASDQSEWTR